MAFGLNTEQEKFKEEITGIATSIKNEFKIEVAPKKVIAEFCNLFEEKIRGTIQTG